MTTKTEPVSEPYKLPVADGKGEERRVFVLYERDEHLPGVEVRVGFHAGPARDWRPMAGSFADGHAAESCVVAFVERREPTARERTEMVNAAWSALKSRGVTNLSAADVEAAIESALRKSGDARRAGA